MKNFLKGQREILALLGYGVVIFCLVYFVILPLIGRMHDMNDQIQQESMRQESAQAHISQLPKIQKQYQALQSDGDLSDVLLDKNKAVVLIEKLEKLAESTNNKIAISVQDDASSQGVKKVQPKVAASTAKLLIDDLPKSNYLQMKITLTGDYNSVVAFIGMIEKFEYYTDITAIQINKYADSISASQAVSTSGMFGSVAINVPNKVPIKQNATDANMLTASLDTVFYTN